MGDYRGIETVLGVQGFGCGSKFRAGAKNPTGWLMGCQNNCLPLFVLSHPRIREIVLVLVGVLVLDCIPMKTAVLIRE
jgi:hypothetical protein